MKSITRKIAKNSSDEPRSFSATSTTSETDPHEQQRAQVCARRGCSPENAARRDGEQLAVLGEVGGEEEHDEDLGDLAGLERQPREVYPQLRAVDLASDERGQQQQDEAAHHERVLVARERLERRHRDERGHECCHADEQPHHLACGELLIETRDHGQADAGQHEHDREQARVGVCREAAHCEVGDDEGEQQRAGYEQTRGLERLGALRVDEGEDEEHRRRGREQEQQFCRAA